MTALQDWLSSSPVAPASIKTVLWDAWRGLTSDDDQPRSTSDDTSLVEPVQLMGRGLERC